MADLTRRDVLQRGAALAVPLLTGSLPAALAQDSPAPGIRKALDPALLIPQGTNAEMRWSAMRGAGYLTPTDRFFVRNHTTTPLIDRRRWRLDLFGSGLKGGHTRADPVSFGLRDLERLEPRSLVAAVECAGNARTGFAQQGQEAAGTKWGLGAIGVARWRGVALGEVLERAGLRRQAVDVLPEGLDDTVKDSAGADQGHVRRPLPVQKALDDVLIALEMNGRDLPADHGAPARLIVPGWVGIANIKWLGAMEVSADPLFSYWNTTQYRVDDVALTTQVLKSAFEVDPGATFAAGRRVRLHGRSWSGTARPERVEVSTDGGASWRRATLAAPNRTDAWVRWWIDWTPRAAGPVDLIARATDRRGRRQQATTPFNPNGYLFGGHFRTPVTVA